MKKKGLIISTIVMVVVLIASLTTATYAWFSSQASAKVDTIQIRTQAATGLEIALSPTSGTYYSGSIEVDAAGVWSGDDGFGASLTMASGVGQMEHAVTKVASATTRYPYKVTVADTFPAGATKVYSAATEGSEVSTAPVNTIVYCTYAADTYIVPVSYVSGTSTPESYVKANVNRNYLWLPIVIRTTSATITNIYYKVTLTPQVGTIKEGMLPGMAAASRITYSKDASGTATATAHEPFSSWHVSGSTMVSSASGSSKNWAESTAQNKKYVYYGLLLAGTSAVDQGSEYTLDILSWIEGTDTECINACAGSGYDITIEFLYSTDTTALTTGTIPQTGWTTDNEAQNLT